jgi:CubicO group peptidase (beta-lactamase class C family)
MRERNGVDIDALEQRALEAWRDIETFDGPEDSLPGGVLPGFAERVVASESQVVPLPVPPLVVVDANVPSTPPRRRWSVSAAVGLVGAAGLAAIAIVSTPTRQGSTPVVETPSVVSAGAAMPAAVDPDAVPIPADLDDRIESYIADYGAKFGPAFKFHGAILVAREGEVAYAQGFGTADPVAAQPNTVSTRFRLGFLSEQFTAAAILQLRDRGHLDLDDPISRWLPAFPAGERITVRHLLSHRSGVPDYIDAPDFHAWKAEPHTTEEMLDRIAAMPLEFEPGTDFSLTNSGYYLLGAIIEKATGQPYGEFVRASLFRPLGMTQTGFGDAYESGEQARGNVWNPEEVLDPPDPIDMSVFGGAGGIVSSALDLVEWDRALYDGAVLSPASVEEMLTADEVGYGYGWIIDEQHDQRVAKFEGLIDGFRSAMYRFTGDRTLVVVLCNTEVVPCSVVAEDVATLAYDGKPEPRIEYAEVEIAPGTFGKYLGTYGIGDKTFDQLVKHLDPDGVSKLQTVHVMQQGERLYFDVPSYGSQWMHPMGRDQFFFKDNSRTTVSFELGEDGKAKALVVHEQAGLDLRLERK